VLLSLNLLALTVFGAVLMTLRLRHRPCCCCACRRAQAAPGSVVNVNVGTVVVSAQPPRVAAPEPSAAAVQQYGLRWARAMAAAGLVAAGRGRFDASAPWEMIHNMAAGLVMVKAPESSTPGVFVFSGC
jgi:hypothetical protein